MASRGLVKPPPPTYSGATGQDAAKAGKAPPTLPRKPGSARGHGVTVQFHSPSQKNRALDHPRVKSRAMKPAAPPLRGRYRPVPPPARSSFSSRRFRAAATRRRRSPAKLHASAPASIIDRGIESGFVRDSGCVPPTLYPAKPPHEADCKSKPGRSGASRAPPHMKTKGGGGAPTPGVLRYIQELIEPSPLRHSIGASLSSLACRPIRRNN